LREEDIGAVGVVRRIVVCGRVVSVDSLHSWRMLVARSYAGKGASCVKLRREEGFIVKNN
jgi:hypothetical protein